jgi:hypothetical protein
MQHEPSHPPCSRTSGRPLPWIVVEVEAVDVDVATRRMGPGGLDMRWMVSCSEPIFPASVSLPADLGRQLATESEEVGNVRR